MNRIGRRAFLGTGLASTGVALAYGGVSLRVHSTPERFPDLTDDHLASLKQANASSSRVLVVGNSATIGSSFLENLSSSDSPAMAGVHFSRASANGARLVETLRLPTFRALLEEVDWNVLVLQDFSSTALSFGDRQASILAIRAMAGLARPASIVLFPHWPSAPGHRVYDGGLGFRYRTPENMADYAARSQAHYENAARQCGGHVAPVLEHWMAAVNSGQQLYLADRHHANQMGSKLAARAVWRAVSSCL
ncbi:hypothetical protein SAMN05444336_11326 [Albimonas donghaensis]|uniref:SGNH/GDSL hydrolase family protein n=1 Tax=Albimonas donghaensis TaxID=356660 RepID=A0A1H3FNJ6_9RHOB|nr:hypothetical protein [Albimonas donghaensis]SDX92377.1 hypothetical protein SAMN05444336_11326 [Albimonas donghaensis]